MKVKTKKQLKKACDIAWSLAIRSKGYCEICGSNGYQLNAHHIIGRAVMILRFDIKNGVCLCVNCHEFSNDSVKNNPLKFINWLKQNRLDDLEYVENKAELIAHYTILDYERIYKELKEIYAKLEI